MAQSSSGSAPAPSQSSFSEWATSLCHHLQQHRPSAPLSPVLPRVLAPAVERHLRQLIDGATKVQRRAKRATLSVDDVNFALALSRQECVYGFSSSRAVQVTGWDGKADTVWVGQEPPVELADVAQAALPPAPLAPSLSLHWLAVEGTQPKVPQNPSQSSASKGKGGRSSSSSTSSTAGDATPGLAHVLSREMQLVLTQVCAEVRAGGDSDHDAPRGAALSALLATDSGLQELMPYLAQFIQGEVANNLRDLGRLLSVMDLLNCILGNPNLHVELYLHQLMPAVLTCVVGKKLCQDPSCDNHHRLRDRAARAVAHICRRYGAVYANLQPRVTKALFDALQGDKPLATQYGAVVAVSHLGPLCVHLLLLPLMPQLCARFEAALTPPPPLLQEQADTNQSTAAGTSKAGSKSSSKSGKGKGKRLREASLLDDAHKAGRARVAACTEAHEARACLSALTAAVAVYLDSLGLGSVNDWPPARALAVGAGGAAGGAGVASSARVASTPGPAGAKKPAGRGKSKGAAVTAAVVPPAGAGSAEVTPGEPQDSDDAACRHGPAKRAKRQQCEQPSKSEKAAASEMAAASEPPSSTSGGVGVGVGDVVVEALGESLVPFYARLHATAAAALLI